MEGGEGWRGDGEGKGKWARGRDVGAGRGGSEKVGRRFEGEEREEGGGDRVT